MGKITPLLSKVDDQLDREMAIGLEEGLKDVANEIAAAESGKVAVLRPAKPKNVFDAIDMRINAYRQDVSAHEKAINTLQRNRDIREAELKADLAALAQEMAERRAELDREERERSAKLQSDIAANREKSADEIKARSALLAASHAALDSLLKTHGRPADAPSLQAAE